MEKLNPTEADLSQVVIKVVEKLKLLGRPVNQENVLEILSKDPSIALMVSEKVYPEKVSSGTNPLKLLQEAEEECKRVKSILRSSMAVFTPFLKLPESKEIKASFDKFKEILKDEDVPVETLEKRFVLLKETVLQSGVKPSKQGVKKIFGFFGSGVPELKLEDFKEYVSRFTSSLDILVSDVNKPKWMEIKNTLMDVTTVSSFAEWVSQITPFIDRLALDIKEEKERLNDFITELGNNLIEIEKNIVDYIGHFRSSSDVSKQLNYHLDGQVDDLRQSVKASGDIEDLRKIVITKLSYIKQALEKKIQHEKQYNQELEQKMQRLQKELNSINDQIKITKDREKLLRQEIMKDPLTNIANRRAYEIRITEEWERFKRYDHVFSLAIIDLDNFKRINDSFGHKAGDLILKELARSMEHSIRKTDMVCRYGGEEFVVIFTGTKAEQAKEAAEKLRKIIEATRFVYKSQNIPVTVSIGIAQAKKDYEGPAGIFEEADKALYIAKTEGKNRVQVL